MRLYFKAKTICLVLCLYISNSATGEVLNTGSSNIRIPTVVAGTEEQYNYYTQLLELALANTANEYGTARLVPSELEMVQTRQLKSLTSHLLDIIWSVTSKEREQNYLPIRVPLSKGLFGYRLFLVSETSKSAFSKDTSIEQIKTLTAVQGYDWPDTDILKANGFEVITGSYIATFKLLNRHYSDYYPRGVLEIEAEAEQHKDEGISIEPHHAIYYPNLMYFFVAKENIALAVRLEKGLQTVISSGELDRLFARQKFSSTALELLKGREIHILKNPYMSESSAAVLKQFKLEMP